MNSFTFCVMCRPLIKLSHTAKQSRPTTKCASIPETRTRRGFFGIALSHLANLYFKGFVRALQGITSSDIKGQALRLCAEWAAFISKSNISQQRSALCHARKLRDEEGADISSNNSSCLEARREEYNSWCEVARSFFSLLLVLLA